jgi:hypothetical protein
VQKHHGTSWQGAEAKLEETQGLGDGWKCFDPKIQCEKKVRYFTMAGRSSKQEGARSG